MKKLIRKIFKFLLRIFYPSLYQIESKETSISRLQVKLNACKISSKAVIYGPSQMTHTDIGDYTYIAQNSQISYTIIGKFCSIGPNLLCGWGMHPINGISTSPMFYSTKHQNGVSLSLEDKVEERKEITIGNDVFIGMNVTILDGITIGDGAVIGAGAVVSKDIPPYAVAVGSPIRIIKYRFSESVIENLLQIKWWDFDEERLKEVEKYFFDIEVFVKHHSTKSVRSKKE